jgi:C1A family cysteine protease
MPSRLFVYYFARPAHLRTVDSGTTIRAIVKTLAQQGVCPEQEWPYDIGQFTMQPSVQCVTDARNERAISYQRIPQALSQMKACLAGGYPFIFGFTVYSSFESDAVAQTGFVPMPGPAESVLGGHAVMAVGYDDATQRFLIRNSWGTSWGQQGYCTMPYAYLLSSSLSGDFWMIKTVQ